MRLWNTTIDGHIDAVEYFQNLHSGEHGVQFVNLIENPNGRHCHWKYVVPLSAYLTHLEQNEMDMPFAFVRQEHLESDMDTLEYPTMGYKVEPGESFERVPTNESEFAGHIRTGFNVKPTDVKWEAGDGQTDMDFYRENPECAEIVRLYYSGDFERFGYSLSPEDIAK